MHPIATSTPNISNQLPVQTLQAQVQAPAPSPAPGPAADPSPQYLDSWLGSTSSPWLGSARLGPARPDSAWLGSARLGLSP